MPRGRRQQTPSAAAHRASKAHTRVLNRICRSETKKQTADNRLQKQKEQLEDIQREMPQAMRARLGIPLPAAPEAIRDAPAAHQALPQPQPVPPPQPIQGAPAASVQQSRSSGGSSSSAPTHAHGSKRQRVDK